MAEDEKAGTGSTRSKGKAAAQKPPVDHTAEEQITAPSLGPNTVINREPVEDRLARHEQSQVDAMGKDKRRMVVGSSYGPSKTRQATLYGIAVAVIVALGVGGKLLADKLDQPPDHITATAPWSQADAPQHPPKPLQ